MLTDQQDADEVGAVVDRYTDATYRGDVDALRECFHPSAMMSGFLDGALLVGSPEPFFQDLGGRPSMESGGLPYSSRTASLEVVGRVASVRVDETGFPGGMAFTNWFQLLKDEDDRWKIVAKLFTSRDADARSDR